MKNINGILLLALLLIVIWIVATVTRFIAGAMLNLLLLASIGLFIVWAFRRLR